MGAIFSRKTPESEPLIIPSADTLPEASSRFQKGIDVLAALKANKLPSQDQLNTFLQLSLLDVLNADGVAGHGPVSEDVKKLVLDVRESVEAVFQIGMEKNDDDRVQDLLFECSKIEATPIRVPRSCPHAINERTRRICRGHAKPAAGCIGAWEVAGGGVVGFGGMGGSNFRRGSTF